MGMDRKIEKKKGVRPKHFGYALAGLAFTFLLIKIIYAYSEKSFRKFPARFIPQI